MTKREICERLLILYADVNSLQTQIGVWNEPLDDAERDIRKAILDIAAPEEEPEDKEAVKKPAEKPSAQSRNGWFAYIDCDCGGKAYVKLRTHEDEPLIAKCAACGRVIRVHPLGRLGLTMDAPPENLFADEEETK